jgi:hypothetical protein
MSISPPTVGVQKEQKLGISPATSSTGSQSCQWESTISKRKMEETETTHLESRHQRFAEHVQV